MRHAGEEDDPSYFFYLLVSIHIFFDVIMKIGGKRNENVIVGHNVKGLVLVRGRIMAAAVIFTGDEEVSCVIGDGAEIEHGGAGDTGLGGGGVAWVEGPAFEDGLVVVCGEGGDV